MPSCRLAGEAGGALFNPRAAGLERRRRPAAMLRLMPELRRDYDSGLGLGLGGTFARGRPAVARPL